MQAKKVLLLGSTGSIGQSALQVARLIPERMEVVGLAAHRSVDILLRQVGETGAKLVCLTNERAAEEASKRLPPGVRLFRGEAGLIELVDACEASMALIAIIGTAGLPPALRALERGMDLAVASKEILVTAGEWVMGKARELGRKVLPVDSEHNAIFQCLEGRPPEHVRRLILTASGGPFRCLPAEELADVTVERALKHPTWEMGRKITIDSATLFNKGLEMIEARWLFDVEMARIDVIVHPQSIVHSMVEFVDGSVLAQLSASDMCFPIQYAVTWPDRVSGRLNPLNFAELSKLEFEAPRTRDFPALDLARQAGTTGGTLPVVLNAANEVAVEAFLERKCTFPQIWKCVATIMEGHASHPHPSLDDIFDAERWAKARAREWLKIPA